MTGIGTCAATLARPGRCCAISCSQAATLAVLFDGPTGFTECLRCDEHCHIGSPLEAKTYRPAPGWEPVDLGDGLRARVDELEQRIAAALDIDPADHATRSRDYGRGFADAIRQVRGVLQPGPVGVWRDDTHKHYGWTCPRCRLSYVNQPSEASARASFAMHACPR
jgi:hypothetical protein